MRFEHGKHWHRNTLSRYGLTEDDFYQLWADQEGLCGICAAPLKENTFNTVIDHDHDTKVVRGLLHRTCNNSLEWADAHRDRIQAWMQRGY